MFKATKIALASLAAVNAEVYFKETFDATWEDRWVTSGDGKFSLSAGDFYGDAEADKGLMTTQDARFYHMSSTFDEFSNKGKDVVLSFSVKHGQNIDCGGGYLKFTGAGLDTSKFNGDTDYNVMFGPDICGSSTKKVHVILNYNGKNVELNKNIACKTDELTHFYTLVLKSDNTYEVHIDGEKKESGSLKEDFDFLEAKEIEDPALSKPTDWVDEAMIDDPEDVKPEGHDDITAQIVDPEAEKPDDWDDEDDGEWEAPQIANPEYTGEWHAKRIDNPAYEGVWVHPKIANPDFVDDNEIYSFESFGGVGVDVWQVKSGSIFDNVIIADTLEEVTAFNTEVGNQEAEKAMKKTQDDEKSAADEAARKAADEAAAAEDDEDDDDDDEEEEDVDEAIKDAKKEL